MVAKALGPTRSRDRFGSRCRGHTRRKYELRMVSAARMRPGRGLLALYTLSPHSQARPRLGSQQARLGQVPVSSGHRWLRGQGAREQREGKKWQLPIPH